jgi:hypothetical protein
VSVSQQHINNDAVLDRQISEQDARIRSNPRDAVAYRERGFFYARKRRDYVEEAILVSSVSVCSGVATEARVKFVAGRIV